MVIKMCNFLCCGFSFRIEIWFCLMIIQLYFIKHVYMYFHKKCNRPRENSSRSVLRWDSNPGSHNSNLEVLIT